jgi:hypothetical protein
MDERIELLRLGIDGHWEAREFAASFTALNRLYTLRLGLAVESEELQDMRNLYMDFPLPPFARSMKHFRRWATLLPPASLRSEFAPSLANPEGLARWEELFEPQERLVVRRVIYGSPGVNDLAGIGEIIGHIKDLLVHILEHWSARRQRDLENDRRELENEQLQIQVAKDYVGLAREIGYSKREIRQLVASVVREQRPLIQLVAAGKVTSADTIENETELP